MKNLRGNRWWTDKKIDISLKECPFCGSKKINSRFYECGLYVVSNPSFIHVIHECQNVATSEELVKYNLDIGI